MRVTNRATSKARGMSILLRLPRFQASLYPKLLVVDMALQRPNHHINRSQMQNLGKHATKLSSQIIQN